MSIPAKRFKILDYETNIASTAFTGLGSELLNAEINRLNKIPETLQEIIDSVLEAQDLDAVKDTIDETLRKTKDIESTLSDLAALPREQAEAIVNQVSGGNSVINKALKNAIDNCAKIGGNLGRNLPGKPYDVSISCNGRDISLTPGTSGCDAASISDILNKATGGAYGSAYRDINSILRRLMALSTAGMDMGLCGVFNALKEGLPQDVLSKAAGSLLGHAASTGNGIGFMDIAKSSEGLQPLQYAPGVIGQMIESARLPLNEKHFDPLDYVDRLLGGFELLDSNWTKSQHSDRMPTIAMANIVSQDMRTLFETKLTSRSFDEDEIDSPVFDDPSFIMAAFQFT